MKLVLLFPLLSIGMLQVNSPLAYVEKTVTTPNYLSHAANSNEAIGLGSQPGPDNEKMSAIMFKSQEFCRAELKDFDFDAHFSIVSATVYFSGTNFKGAEKGAITSSSLKPIRGLMNRCAAGSMVIFDNVKVIGPDKEVRTIQGTSIVLY